MAALLKDETEHPTVLRVSPEGFQRLQDALENPQAPPPKLIEMMQYLKRVKSQEK